MALSYDWDNRIVHSTASITDVVAFHVALRDAEDSEEGMIVPIIHTYKAIDLGGAVFPAVAFINGWTLQFPAGNYEIRGGNINATINPVAGVFVKQTQSAAYAVTSIGAGGATPADIADAVVGKTLGARTLGAHIQAIAAPLVGNQSGAGTTTNTYTDGPVSVTATVPLPGEVGNRTGVVISGA